MTYGSVLASFNVEEFGTERVGRLTRDEINERFDDFRRMTELDALLPRRLLGGCFSTLPTAVACSVEWWPILWLFVALKDPAGGPLDRVVGAASRAGRSLTRERIDDEGRGPRASAAPARRTHPGAVHTPRAHPRLATPRNGSIARSHRPAPVAGGSLPPGQPHPRMGGPMHRARGHAREPAARATVVPRSTTE